MKSNCYSPSTPWEQGALLACPFQNAQKSGKEYDTTILTSAEIKHKPFSPYTHYCTGIIPFDVMEKTFTITPQKQRINEVSFYCSGKEIARWLVKKSEYNKLDLFI